MVADRNDAWNLRTPEGTVYGPVPKSQLEQWVREGRVTGECAVQSPHADVWQRADIVFPALQEPEPAAYTTPASTSKYSPHALRAGETESRKAAHTATSGRVFLQPHRGALILVLALVGLVVQCPVFSVLAWVLGSSDLTEMREGRMDPAGEPATRAGRSLGMLLVFIWGIIFSVSAVAVPLLFMGRR